MTWPLLATTDQANVTASAPASVAVAVRLIGVPSGLVLPAGRPLIVGTGLRLTTVTWNWAWLLTAPSLSVTVTLTVNGLPVSSGYVWARLIAPGALTVNDSVTPV